MADKKISQLTAATTPLAGTEVLPIVQSGSTVKVANNDLRPKQIQSNSTSGVLQVTGPAAASTRVMTTPDANFTVARTDTSQTFSGDQTFSSDVIANTFAATGAVSAHTTNGENQIGSSTTYGLTLIGKGSTSNTTIFASNGGVALLQPTGTYNIEIPNGNVIMGSGQGIDFSATASGSGTMTSELLADYEEGTWTPIDSSGAGLTFTHTATYIKVGNLVRAGFQITFPSTADTTNVLIGGLPYVVANNNAARAGGIDGYNNYGATLQYLAGPNVTTMSIYKSGNVQLTNANLSTCSLYGCIIYNV